MYRAAVHSSCRQRVSLAILNHRSFGVCSLHCANPQRRLLGVTTFVGMEQMEMKMMRDANPHIRDPVYWEQIAKLKGLAPARTTMPATPRSSH